MKNKSTVTEVDAEAIKKADEYFAQRLREIGDRLEWDFEQISAGLGLLLENVFNEILRAYSARAKPYKKDQEVRLVKLFIDTIAKVERGVLEAERGESHVQ